ESRYPACVLHQAVLSAAKSAPKAPIPALAGNSPHQADDQSKLRPLINARTVGLRPCAPRPSAAPVPLSEFSSDQAVDGIGAAAAERDGEHHDAEKQHIFIAAGADREALDP